MSGERANPFGNLERFKPKTSEPVAADAETSVKSVAERSGFQSREAAAKAETPRPALQPYPRLHHQDDA